MGMSVPLILITGWTLLHVQEFYVSLLTRINTQVAREVSEGEKALTRSISDGLTAQYLSLSFHDYGVLHVCEAAVLEMFFLHKHLCQVCSASTREMQR